MGALTEVFVSPVPLERFVPILGEAAVADVIAAATAMRQRAANRIVWNVSSTAVGGGVAEMLRSLLPFARGAGVDTRWMVIHGTPEFFRVTKRIHNALHGEPGDASPLGPEEHRQYDRVLCENAQELLAMVRVGDVVLLHDPQTIGLAPYLQRAGASVIWRCHIGADVQNAETAYGWDFLAPYLRDVGISVFTRAAYVPPLLDRSRTAVIQPSIDPFSAKNQPMDERSVHAIVSHIGLIAADPDTQDTSGFQRADGTPGRVDHCADILRLGPPPPWDAPLVVQVSRWDRLKDPLGVLHGFDVFAESGDASGAHLMLVGPNVNSVADDPDGAAVFEEVTTAWRALPHHVRRMVHLVNLPTVDVEENAAMVNAIQRHAAVIVQKSLREGFGLTVTEAMWKSRPVVATAVGGITDQIEDGVSGLLLHDPTDAAEFAAALRRILPNPTFAKALGEHAHDRVREHFLGMRHLLEYARVIARMEDSAIRHAA